MPLIEVGDATLCLTNYLLILDLTFVCRLLQMTDLDAKVHNNLILPVHDTDPDPYTIFMSTFLKCVTKSLAYFNILDFVSQYGSSVAQKIQLEI